MKSVENYKKFFIGCEIFEAVSSETASLFLNTSLPIYLHDMTIIHITAKTVRTEPELFSELVALFDDYRVYYEQESDQEAAHAYLAQRLEEEESVIYMARENGVALGFTQLYPMFSSISMNSMWVLNDLFVTEEGRNAGTGTSLLTAAQHFCRREQAKGLALETGKENPAQKLYERLGWEKDQEYLHYFWKNE